MLKALLARTPDRVRRLIYGSPAFHAVARRLSAASYPDDTWQWCQIAGGSAEGLWIQAKPRTHKFFVAGTYERAFEQALMSHAQRGVVWDVGSHIGYFVLVALRLGCSVIAIEPNPSNVQRIRATLARNDLACTVLQIAAGPSFRTAKLAVEGDSSTGRISAHGVSVRTVPLDILLESHPAPALIKIDVEGFEAEVLRGADRLLNEIRPVFLIELHPWADETFVFEQLGAYDITTFDEHHLLAMPTSGPVHLTKHQPAF